MQLKIVLFVAVNQNYGDSQITLNTKRNKIDWNPPMTIDRSDLLTQQKWTSDWCWQKTYTVDWAPVSWVCMLLQRRNDVNHEIYLLSWTLMSQTRRETSLLTLSSPAASWKEINKGCISFTKTAKQVK